MKAKYLDNMVTEWMNEVSEGGCAPMAFQHIGGFGAAAGRRASFNRNDSVDTAGSIGNTSLGIGGTQHLLGVPKSDSPGLLSVPSGGHSSQFHYTY